MYLIVYAIENVIFARLISYNILVYTVLYCT